MSRYRIRTALVVLATAFFALFGSTAAASASTSTTTTANTATSTFHGVTLTVTSANGVTPNITEQSCVGRDEWVHLYTTGGDLCFGFVGTMSVSSNDTYAWCWGNNNASYRYAPLANGDRNVTSVTIYGWSGNATCPV